MYLNNLTTNKVYDLKVQAGTRSQVGDRLMHFGPFSQMQRVLLQPGCEAMRTFAPRSTEQNDSVILINLEDHLGTIAGAVCGTLGLLLAIFAFLLCITMILLLSSKFFLKFLLWYAAFKFCLLHVIIISYCVKLLFWVAFD